jgi:hypothetical protein
MLLPQTTAARLLIGLLILISTFAGGAYVGYNYCEGRHAKAESKAKDAVIERASEEAVADKQDAVKRVQREVVASSRARAVKSEGLSDASLKASPTCLRDPESFRLLTRAIDSANGTKEHTGGVPDGVPEGTDPKGWLGLGYKGLGIRAD